MSEKDEKSTSSQNQDTEGLMRSVTTAFNLGVAANQSSAHLKSVTEVSAELGQQIYDNLSKAYGEQYDDNFLLANTEFFLQVALLGYIIPSVCVYEEDFKDRLFSLIEKKSAGAQSRDDSSIETPPDKKIIY